MTIAIIVHGGAGALQEGHEEAVQAGCREAALVGWRILQQGGSSLDAVEAAVRELEDNPRFNAGTGSCLTSEGNIEMDAGLMEGHTLRVGAVAAVEHIKNPIALARTVLESPHVLLTGQGAEQFAREQGLTFCTREDLLTERQYANWLKARGLQDRNTENEPRFHRREIASLPARQSSSRNHHDEPSTITEEEEKHGTVGAAAIDGFGTLSAATSTGGFLNKYPGRVGDSPLVGCGFYADNNAAISCTGHGEEFIRLLLARRAADFVAAGAPANEAAKAAIALLGERVAGSGGLIIVDRLGNVGFARNTRHMSYAYLRGDLQEAITGV